MRKAFIDSFNGRMRDEVQESLFFGLDHAWLAIAEWASDYNIERPLSALNDDIPAEVATTITAIGADAPPDESSASAPIAQASQNSASTAETPVAAG